MIKQADRKLELKRLEEQVQRYWEEGKIYEKSKSLMKDKKKYYFLDGPPYASGAIHLGTAWNKILKDAIVRYLAMNGYNVRRQAGWDCHGLPIEIKVEEKLGIKNKKEIEELGVEKFIKECEKWAHEHIGVMSSQFKRLGVWMDWEKPYMTLSEEYVEAAWWTLKKAHEKKLLTRDLRPVMWCPRCETALAEAEIEYWDRSDPSIYIKFPVAEKRDEYLLVWTTTPWTLIGNLAVTVHPRYTYVKAKTNEGTLILAEELAGILKEKFGLDYEIVEKMSGVELEGLRYRNPLSDVINFKPKSRNAYTVILGDFVTLEEGTGCVHTAPGHGPEDFEAGVKYGIEAFSPVDERGRFTDKAGKYKGRKVKADDWLIVEDMEKLGALLSRDKITHRYGHCWRCSTPIIYRATEQWFIKITKLKDRMLKEMEKVDWVPDWAGSARFRGWIENARDWTISRQRYWGIPIPIWTCRKCGEMQVIGSRRELGMDVKLHKPFADEVKLKCRCGGSAARVEDILDVWFDSGVAAWASLGYPGKKEEFKKWYPVDFITEGHDQTRGWFYSQLGCGLLAFDEVPYRRVLMHGFTLDEKGEKMSKSLGNVVQPEEVIDVYGADVLRFYILWANKPWEDLRFSWEEVKVVARMFNIFWNVYVFATTYMSIDKFDPGKKVKIRKKEDLWMLSRLNSVIEETTKAFKSLHIQSASRAIHEFILEDLSRWYVTLVRPRIWIEKDAPEKFAAYSVLYECLLKLAVVMSPIAPHITEEIFRNLSGGKESVHQQRWVALDTKAVDKKLEEQMSIVRKYVEAEASAREKAGIKRRWPVLGSMVKPKDKASEEALLNLSPVVEVATNTLDFKVIPKGKDFKPPAKNVSTDFEFGTVAINTEKNDEILARGYAREIVRRVQQMRKERDLDIEAFIEAKITSGDSALDRIINEQRDYISRETRAKLKISPKVKHRGYKKEWKVGEINFTISINKM